MAVWHIDVIGVKKQKPTLTAYGIANIFPHKKNNA